MNHRQIIITAWKMSQTHKRKLFWFGFIPSFLSTLVGIVYVLYQYYSFKSSPIFTGKDFDFIGFFQSVWEFATANTSFSIVLLVVAVFVVLAWFFTPPIFHGGIIQLVFNAAKGKEVRKRDGISAGLLHYVRLFEFHSLTEIFSLTSIFTAATYFPKYVGLGAFYAILAPLIFLVIVVAISFILFIYVEYFVVLKDENVIKAIGSSCRLVIFYFTETFIVGALMLIIGLRVIINILVVFLVPIIVITLAGYLASVFLTPYAIILSLIIGLILLCIAAYIGGTFNIFAIATWELAFFELMKKEKVEKEETLDELINKAVSPTKEEPSPHKPLPAPHD